MIDSASFTSSDINLSGSTAGGPLVATITQPDPANPLVFNVAVTGMTSMGRVVARIPANATTDRALNSNPASTSTDNSVKWN